MFSLIYARTNGWVDNREAGDLRRYRAHYDVIVMHRHVPMSNITDMWPITVHGQIRNTQGVFRYKPSIFINAVSFICFFPLVTYDVSDFITSEGRWWPFTWKYCVYNVTSWLRFRKTLTMSTSCYIRMTSSHCGLVTPYGGRDLGHHWHDVDLSSLRSSDVHLGAISLEISQPSVTKISLKIVFIRFNWNLPGANELSIYYGGSHIHPRTNSMKHDFFFFFFGGVGGNNLLLVSSHWLNYYDLIFIDILYTTDH